MSSVTWAERAQALMAEAGPGSSPLRQGRSHLYGFVTIHGRRVFVKVCRDRRRLVRLANEHRWLRTVWKHDPGLVPEPLGYVESRSAGEAVLVTAAVDGESRPAIQRSGSPPDEPVVRAFASGLARLHRLPLTASSIQFDGEVWPDWASFVLQSLHRYLQDIESMGGALSATTQARLRSVVEQEAPVLGQPQIGPVHGDPTLANAIIRSDRQVCLVDFEVAQYGDYLLDLSIARLFEFSDQGESWRAFLDEYGLPVDDDAVRRRLWLYRILRQVRLLRGKLWIYQDPAGFAQDLARLEQTLAGDGR